MNQNKKIVIKVGTGVLTREADGQLDEASLVRLVTGISDLVLEGDRVLLVSSGAVGAGVAGLELDEYPSDTATRQACASVGQSRVMHAYENLFRNFGIKVAQLLLTAADFNEVDRCNRVKDTLARLKTEELLVPIINENDTVAVDELSVGENDMLAARVSKLVKADMLIILTSVDGLLPPGGEEIVQQVADVDSVLDYARGESGKFSTGGMETKLLAVKYAVDAGVETVIANGENPERLAAIASGSGRCTRFLTK